MFKMNSIENTIPDDIKIELKDINVVCSETGNYSILPSDTIQKAEKVLQEIGVHTVELIEQKRTDGVPIFKTNEAYLKPKCHRQACRMALPPTPLDNPPKECFGKGMTVTQSKASAMMEAIERYCAQQFPHSSIIEASHNEVEGYAVDPSEFKFPNLPPKCRNCLDKYSGCFQDLQEVCHEWTWGYSLVSKTPVLVPSALVYYPYISKAYTSFMYNDTGGLAAGNTVEEAILQGIAEVIERDALYYSFNLGNVKDMPILDLTDTKNTFVRKFINDILPQERIFAFCIWNESFDLGVPTCSAFVCYRKGEERRYFGGSGTNLDPEVALLRALTELEQQKVRQKGFAGFDQNDLVHNNNPRRWNIAHLNGISHHSSTNNNIGKEIEIYVDRLSKNNTDIIVVDLTHPEVRIPVVRVVIPKFISYSGSSIEESVFLHIIESNC